FRFRGLKSVLSECFRARSTPDARSHRMPRVVAHRRPVRYRAADARRRPPEHYLSRTKLFPANHATECPPRCDCKQALGILHHETWVIRYVARANAGNARRASLNCAINATVEGRLKVARFYRLVSP